MNTLIIIINLVFFSTLLFFTNAKQISGDWQKSEAIEITYEVRGVTYPTDLELVGGSLYILKENSLINWDIEKRTIKEVREIEPKTILDSEEGKLFTCSWENYEISSPEENASLIIWRDRERTQEIAVNRTVRPIRCLKERIIAMNAFPTLQEKHYEIDIRSENLKEILYIKDTKENSQKGVIVDPSGKITVTIDKKNDVKGRLIHFFQLLINNVKPS